MAVHIQRGLCCRMPKPAGDHFRCHIAVDQQGSVSMAKGMHMQRFRQARFTQDRLQLRANRSLTAVLPALVWRRILRCCNNELQGRSPVQDQLQDGSNHSACDPIQWRPVRYHADRQLRRLQGGSEAVREAAKMILAFQ